jgi:hypothetical protein
MSSIQDSEYANELIGDARRIETIKRQVQEERELAIVKFQKESFPADPVLLYVLIVTHVSGEAVIFYAIPDDDMLNPELAQKLVYMDLIQEDALVPTAFINCSIAIQKKVFGSIEDIRNTSLMVYDQEMNAVRASKVLLGLPGMAKKPQQETTL